MNLAAVGLLVLWARSRGLSWEEMGVSTDRRGSAIRWGIGLGVAVPAPLLLVLVLPDSIGSLADPRGLGDLSTAELAYQTLVRIPIGTALCEEVAFRGVLFGVWAKGSGVRNALVGSTIAFGLWHVTPTFELMDGSGLFPSLPLLAVAVVVGVLASAVGGLFFAWLRLRTGSIYGPAVTHGLISALAAFFVWMTTFFV